MKKVVMTIMVVSIILLSLNVFLNLGIISLRFQTKMNWNIDCIPSVPCKIIYKRSTRGGLQGDGSEYTVLLYMSDWDLQLVEPKNRAYQVNGKTYHIEQETNMSEKALEKVVSALDRIAVHKEGVYRVSEEVPKEYIPKPENIDFCVEITSDGMDDSICIFQDKTHHQLFMLQEFL